jgi:hypothetical protein
MQRPWLVLTFLVVAISPQLVEGGETASPHPIVDSGVWATNSFPGDVYWIDNERVLFLGSEDGKPAVKEHEALLVWDTTKKAVTLQKRNISSLCYRNGIVLLGQKIDNPAGGPWKYRFFLGPLGEEQLQKKEGIDRLDHLNCRIVEKFPGQDQGHFGRYLLDGHGYLDYGETRPSDLRANPPVVLVKEGASKGIALPFGIRQVESLEFYSFKGAYLLYGWFLDSSTRIVKSPWPNTVPHPLWWLMPEGTVSEVLIPPGVWNSGGSLRFTPTMKGVLATYHGGTKSDHDPGTQGIYLIRENEVARTIIRGFVAHVGVSPDGCRVAFSHAPNYEADRRPNGKNRRTLKMIDLCSEGVQS